MFVTVSDLYHFWASKEKVAVLYRTSMLLLAGLALGFITPYNTDSYPTILGSLLYWVGCLLFIASISGVVARVVLSFLEQAQVNLFIALFVFTTALSLPAFVWSGSWDIVLIGAFFNPDGFTLAYLKEVYSQPTYKATDYLSYYFRVWVLLFVLVTTLSFIVAKRQARPQENEVRSANELLPTNEHRPADERFLRRLPSELGRDLLCLSMEDHYIRVHTMKGNTLILMRMADAIAELEHHSGAQVHRSWWVASEAIEQVIKEQRKISLRLKNDLIVPVSHRRASQLKKTGFLSKRL